MFVVYGMGTFDTQSDFRHRCMVLHTIMSFKVDERENMIIKLAVCRSSLHC
jgi:hypothetical protein